MIQTSPFHPLKISIIFPSSLATPVNVYVSAIHAGPLHYCLLDLFNLHPIFHNSSEILPRAMSNISPGLNDRFANMELDIPPPEPVKTPRSPKKAYPLSLYPQNYLGSTPSRAPILSTAKRAESRTLLLSRSQNFPPLAQKRHLHRPELKGNTGESPSSGRQTKAPDLSHCSFMQQTSSSRKKQSQSERTPSQIRAVSHSEVYNRRTGHLQTQRKRQFSKSHQPADITNRPPQLYLKVPFGDKPTLFSSASPSRHVSTAYTTKAKEDVYTRLYNTATKQKAKLESTRTPLRFRDPGSSHTVATPSQTLPSSTLSYSLSSLLQSTGPAKPSVAADMYRAIYSKDLRLFDESNSLLMDLLPNTVRSPEEFITEQGNNLSIYERGEMMRKQHLYYAPALSAIQKDGNINLSSYKNNYGFDDADGNYIIKPNDQIEFRYEILQVLGTGSFGNVVLCADHKYLNLQQQRKVAIKIIKNELDWSIQAVSEIKMLKHLSETGTFNRYLLNYCDHFNFRGHMCIVTEVLSINLYTFLEVINFLGIGLSLLKNFASQILQGLHQIHEKKVIHCDIKPENIMIKLPSHFDPNSFEEAPGFEVRIIDFGSSCLESETSFSYIQSRFYRAPEVILGAKYQCKIDIWSFGCVVAEMFSGTPLLPGKTELEQIGLILEYFGAPSSSYIVTERKRLMQQIKLQGTKNLNDPLVSGPSMFNGRSKMPIDERKIKKTLLYSLFNLEGKINLQFLNLQLQSNGARSVSGGAPSPFKRNVKLSSKNLEVALKLHSSGESRHDIAQFSKFLSKIFQWDPRERASTFELLSSPFLA